MQPGEYRFPYGNTTKEMEAPAFVEKMKAHRQNRIWWGKSTRFTLTHSVDGLAYALVTGATFGWLWPR